ADSAPDDAASGNGDIVPNGPAQQAGRTADISADMGPGGYAYLPPGSAWSLRNASSRPARLHWIRKSYEAVDGIETPQAFVTNEADVAGKAMPDTQGRWQTQRFVDPADVRHDMHVNIVSFEPGAAIPFPETHVMEHGLYILQGKGMYLLNRD